MVVRFTVGNNDIVATVKCVPRYGEMVEMKGQVYYVAGVRHQFEIVDGTSNATHLVTVHLGASPPYRA